MTEKQKRITDQKYIELTSFILKQKRFFSLSPKLRWYKHKCYTFTLCFVGKNLGIQLAFASADWVVGVCFGVCWHTQPIKIQRKYILFNKRCFMSCRKLVDYFYRNLVYNMFNKSCLLNYKSLTYLHRPNWYLENYNNKNHFIYLLIKNNVLKQQFLWIFL